MSDIVERLRAWVYTDSQYATAREAADEIERLRLSIIGDYPGEDNPAREDNESVRKTGGDFGQPALTAEEREAVERAADWLYRWQETHGYHSSENGDLATLRSLLERVSFIRDYPEPDNTASEDNDPAANSTPNHRTDIEYVRSLEARLEELRTAADQADAEYRTEISSLRMATARLSAANTWLQEEIKRLRLTDAEREAIRWFSDYGDLQSEARRAEVLRGLLERAQ